MSRPPIEQLRILDALREAEARDGRLPALRELARRFGIRYPTLREHRGRRRRWGTCGSPRRGPAAPPEATLVVRRRGLPLYGEIAAGPSVGAEPEAEGFLRLPIRDDQFALRVRGGSTADRIAEGDLVPLRRRPPERRDEICAVRLGDGEGTLK